MKPDFDKAATIATETLIDYGISSAPVSPLPILKSIPGVLVISFAEMSESVGLGRHEILSVFSNHQDAVTSCILDNGERKYVVAYNQMLPIIVAQRALARQLGHILLHHDGSRPDEVRTAEAYCFAYHLLCPRALIRSVQEAGIDFTLNVMNNMTGCDEVCVDGMKNIPGVNVPAELNRKIKTQFAAYVLNFVNYQRTVPGSVSALIDFGTYLNNYKE